MKSASLVQRKNKDNPYACAQYILAILVINVLITVIIIFPSACECVLRRNMLCSPLGVQPRSNPRLLLCLDPLHRLSTVGWSSWSRVPELPTKHRGQTQETPAVHVRS